ncbi:hypothetical protein CspHIS471_0203090 [Cutaneotrichosporon sp. HIS471]|nr:hypothetical protein CspHIS471_0203090 [Cutaneotrichosporon sp. HIS471]
MVNFKPERSRQVSESADLPTPPQTLTAVPDDIGTIASSSDTELRSPTPYYTPGIFDDHASFMDGDDLADRTAALSVSDAGGREVTNALTFPPTTSVWPTSTLAPASPTFTSPTASYATFDVADRSFDKDPNILRAEHAKVSPAVYYRESPLREVPTATHENAQPGDLASSVDAVGVLSAEHGVLHAGHMQARRSLEGQIGDTRLLTDGLQITSDDHHTAPAAQANMPQTSSFPAAHVPQLTDTVDWAQRDMPSAVNLASDPQPMTQINGVASQNGSVTHAPGSASPNQVDTAQQPNKHNMTKAAGVGAVAGLAAAGATRALNSEPQAQAHGDYFNRTSGGEPPVLQVPTRALSPTEAQALPATQPAAASPHANGNHISSPAPVPVNGSFRRVSGQHVEGYNLNRHQRTVSETTRANTAANAQTLERPEMYDAPSPSRSYINAPAPETRYQRPLDEVQRRLSTQSAQRVSRSGSTKFVEQAPVSPGGHTSSPVGAAAAGAAGAFGATALAEHVHTPRADPYARPASAHELSRRSSAQQERDGPFARARPMSAMAAPRDSAMRRDGSGSLRGQLSPSASMRGHGHSQGHGHGRLPPIPDEVGHAGVGAGTGLAVGEVASFARQHEMQGRTLRDDGPVPYDRPYSHFGYRPEVGIGDWAARREEGRLARSGTALSRTTVGRSGTTHSRRSGAFGRGAGLTVGTQPEDVLGREDIHERTEVAERILSAATLRRLQGMEKKEGRAFAKMLKAEGKEQARAVGAALADLKRMAKMQKGAIENERKSQRNLAKWTARENRARMRFLKEKERYEKVEGELRNAENDYEERRDHAAGLTGQIAERTQELDDLRAQKAADDPRLARLRAAEASILASRRATRPTSAITPRSLYALLNISPDIEHADLLRLYVAHVDRQWSASVSPTRHLVAEGTELREIVFCLLLDPDARRAYDEGLHREISVTQRDSTGALSFSKDNLLAEGDGAAPKPHNTPKESQSSTLTPTAHSLPLPLVDLPEPWKSHVVNAALQARQRRSARGPRTPVGEAFNIPPLSAIPVLTSTPLPVSAVLIPVSPVSPSTPWVWPPYSPISPIPPALPPRIRTQSPQPPPSRDHPFLRTDFVREARRHRKPPPLLTPSLLEAETTQRARLPTPNVTKLKKDKPVEPFPPVEDDVPRCLWLRRTKNQAKLRAESTPRLIISAPFNFVHATHAHPPSPIRIPAGPQNRMVGGFVVTDNPAAQAVSGVAVDRRATTYPAIGRGASDGPDTFGRASGRAPSSQGIESKSKQLPAIDMSWAPQVAQRTLPPAFSVRAEEDLDDRLHGTWPEMMTAEAAALLNASLESPTDSDTSHGSRMALVNTPTQSLGRSRPSPHRAHRPHRVKRILPRRGRRSWPGPSASGRPTSSPYGRRRSPPYRRPSVWARIRAWAQRVRASVERV